MDQYWLNSMGYFRPEHKPQSFNYIHTGLIAYIQLSTIFAISKKKQ